MQNGFDVDLERNLLGALIFNNELIEDLSVKPKHIYNNKNKKFLEVIYELHKEGITVDYVTLAEKLKGIWTVTEIAELTDNGLMYQGAFKNIQNKIISLYHIRITRNTLLNGAEALITGKDPQEILSSLYSELSKELDNSSSTKKHISEFMEETLETIEEAYINGGKITGMCTGYPKLDNILNGIEKGKYIVIAARPRIGKSAFAIELSKRLAKNNKVLFYSLEMTGKEIVERALANESRIPMMNMKRGILKEDSFIKLVEEAESLSKLNLVIEPEEGLTIEELERRATKEKRKNGLDVIFIDYLTLLDNEARYRDTREKVNYISERIRRMAKKLDVAVIVLSQLGRAAEGKEVPTIADLKESGNIEQDAHVILLLQDKNGEEGVSCDRLNVHVAKNRSGRGGIAIRYNYYKTTQIIDEI